MVLKAKLVGVVPVNQIAVVVVVNIVPLYVCDR